MNENWVETLHFEAIGGVAGDMLLAALVDVGADVDAIRLGLESMGTPGLRLQVDSVVVNGLEARYVKSLPAAGTPEAAGHHKHVHLADILALIDGATASETAKQRATAVFKLLADAEGKVHGATTDDVHLHEVGELDSILDVMGTAIALDTLGNPAVTCSPLPSGTGTVDTSHGLLECPVPAVAAIAEAHRVPLEPVALAGETITPTGIAIVAQAASAFVAAPASPPKRTGIGAGSRRFEERANVVRAMVWGGA